MTLAFPRSRRRARVVLKRWWRWFRLPGKRLILALALLILFYGLWPYVTLWRLNRALVQDDRATLASLVDLTTIRDEIARRLNKDSNSAIDVISDPFIQWLESGIRHGGTKALDQIVTLDWVSGQLAARSSPEYGFLPAISHGFFEGLKDFRVRIGQAGQEPVTARLHFDGMAWRVTMFYY